MLLCGKIHFNYIYGIGVLGCVAIYGLLNLMAATQVSFCVVVSVLVSFYLKVMMDIFKKGVRYLQPAYRFGTSNIQKECYATCSVDMRTHIMT